MSRSQLWVEQVEGIAEGGSRMTWGKEGADSFRAKRKSLWLQWVRERQKAQDENKEVTGIWFCRVLEATLRSLDFILGAVGSYMKFKAVERHDIN